MSINLDSWRQLPAAQQPEWPDRGELHAVVSRAGRAAAPRVRGRVRPAQSGIWPRSRGARRSSCRAATAPRRSPAPPPTTCATSSRRCCRWRSCSPTRRSVPVVKIGRMAGQFAKPRSKAIEVRDGVELPAYRGDMVNGFDFTAGVPQPRPGAAAAGLPLLRGDAEPLPRLHQGRLRRPAPGPRLEPGLRGESARPARRYERLAGEIDRALAFMRACGADPEEFHRVEFYSRHEALLLDYERALTRIDSPERPAVRRVGAHSCGSASAPGSSTARTWSSCGTSATRSG